MVYGVISWKRWLILIPVTFFLMVWLGIANKPQVMAEEAEAPAQSEANLSGFDLIEAYARKIEKLKGYQAERGLSETELQQRKSRAADELNRLVGGLELLMQQQAEQLFQMGMENPDKEARETILRRIAGNQAPQLQEVRRKAEAELDREKVEEERKSRADREKKIAEQEILDQADIEKLKEELLTDTISKAAQQFAENDAQKMLEAAVRLVLAQRKSQLQEIVRKYPNTAAARQASNLLMAVHQRQEWIASRKLHEAIKAPTHFNQRWRRLKEIGRDYPNTAAATQAQGLLSQHLVSVRPIVISNQTNSQFDLTLDQSYSKLEELHLNPGERKSIVATFPLIVRVKVAENEWNVYRVFEAHHYTVMPRGNHAPILWHTPHQ